MKQSPFSKANCGAASQEIPRLLWNSKGHYHVHRSPSLFPKVHFNIILPFTPRSTKYSLPFTFSKQIVYAFLISHACYLLLPSHRPWFHHLTWYLV